MKTKLPSILFILLAMTMYGQTEKEQEKKIKEISEKTCECINEIDINLSEEKKNEEIRGCITTEILVDQISRQMGDIKDEEGNIDTKKLDSLSKKSNENKNIVILADENYDEIEEYLLRNCKAVKILLMNETEERKYSVSNKSKALEYYNEGNRLYAAGKFENAIVQYRKAVKKDKKFAFAWDNLGICYRKTGNYKAALKAYRKSLKLDPKGKVPLMNIPVALEFLKKYDEAIKSYERLSEVYPDDPEAYYGLGRMYIYKKDYENALDNVMKAYIMYVKLKSPYNRDAQQLISALYAEMKKNDQLDTFNKIAKKHNINIGFKE